MRHTVSASTGMPRRDLALLFGVGDAAPEQRLAEMRSMAPTTGFGEVFQYSNHLVALGGYVAAKQAFPAIDLSSAYDRAIRELVFEPLGMNASCVASAIDEVRAVASPHALDLDGGVAALADRMENFVEGFAPSGAVWSSAGDLAKYLALELSGGTLPDGQRLISAEALARRRSGGVKITNTEAYGLGLFCNTQFGRALLHHGGNTLGFTSDMFFLPDAEIGAVVLTNLAYANSFTEAIRRRILELAFGLDDKAEAMMAGAAEAAASQRRSRRERVMRDPAAADWLEQFAGNYDNSALGGLSIHREADSVWAEFPNFTVELGMDVREEARLLALVSPPFSGSGSLRPASDRAALVLEGGQEEYVYRRL
jgi:CubicO group peptidase (beta-lactamase class C family)